MNGLSCMKRTASTSSSIFAVSSAITALSGKLGIIRSFVLSSPGLAGRSSNHRGRSASTGPAAITGCPAFAGHDSIVLRHHLPLDGLAAAIDQRALVGALDPDLVGRGPRRFFQRDGLFVRRHAIVLRSVERRKGFELVERALFVEHTRVSLDG